MLERNESKHPWTATDSKIIKDGQRRDEFSVINCFKTVTNS